MVSQKNEAEVAPPNVENTCLPSTLSWKVIGVLNAPLASIWMFVEPLTVSPGAGRKNEAASGVVTVTVRVAVAVAPVPSLTVRPRVWAPVGSPLVFQLNDAVVAVPEMVKAWPPSTVSVNVIGVPPAPLADMPTGTVPLTGELAAGSVNHAVSWGGRVSRLIW